MLLLDWGILRYLRAASRTINMSLFEFNEVAAGVSCELVSFGDRNLDLLTASAQFYLM